MGREGDVAQLLHHAHFVTKGGKETFAASAHWFRWTSRIRHSGVGNSPRIHHRLLVALLHTWIILTNLRSCIQTSSF